MATCPKCNGKTIKRSDRFVACPRHGLLRNVVRHALNTPYSPPSQ